MFKYIVKRLLISLLVLFGVSIIIYTLVRLMPNDYIDLKYASQIQQGQITQEDVDRFKELYGIGDKTFKGLVNGYVKWLGNVCRGREEGRRGRALLAHGLGRRLPERGAVHEGGLHRGTHPQSAKGPHPPAARAHEDERPEGDRPHVRGVLILAPPDACA